MNRNHLLTVLAVLAGSLLLATAAVAMPANPAPARVNQPDGSVITIHLRGDEFFSWHESADGLIILKNPETGYWVYAKEANGRLAPTDLVVGRDDGAALGLTRPDLPRIRTSVIATSAHQPQTFEKDLPQIQATTIQNLVILVDFTDLTVDYPTSDFNDMLNQVGFSGNGASGSVRDYFTEISYGNLLMVSTVQDPVTISQGYAYYGANDAEGADLRPREMVGEAIAALDATGFDFSTMDGNGDGWVDGLTILHAGRGEEQGGNDPDYIWSHKWSLPVAVTYDGVSMKDYHTEPSQWGRDSDPSTWGVTHIAVICHESIHFLGLPDTYDRDGSSFGAGVFCLMGSGGWLDDGHLPSHITPWFKMRLGWMSAQWVYGDGSYTALEVSSNPSAIAINGTHLNQEFFLIENRQATGFDAGLPGPGMGLVIWHVDPNISNNDDENHYMVDVEEASGTQHLELNMDWGDDDDYWRAGHMTDFTVTSTPNNIKYDGEALGMEITDISASASSMSFNVTTYHTWVDFYHGGTENGSFLQPYNTLVEGTTNVPIGGGLAIKNGVSYETINTIKTCVLYAPFGNAVIGP